MKFRDYLFSLRFFILFSSAVFLISIFSGYSEASSYPETIEEFSKPLKELAAFIFKMSPFWQAVLVFLNNAIKGFLAVGLGVLFGFFPFFILVFNAQLIGVMAFALQDKMSLSNFILSLLPHGIFEITAFILACAIGMKIGKTAFLKVFFKKGEVHPVRKGESLTGRGEGLSNGVKKEIFFGVEFFLKFLIPLFAVAAIVEIFITPKLI